MWQKTFALAERSLRVDARVLGGHLLRFFIVVGILWFFAGIVADSSFSGGIAPGLRAFSVIAYTNAVLIGVMGIAYFGTTITEEKEERTLPLLMMADISPATLLNGKVLPRLATVTLVLSIQIPFTFLAVTLGGVLVTQLLHVYLALGVYMLAVAGLCTLCSVSARQSGNAIGAAGFLLLAYHVGTPVVGLFARLAQTSSSPTVVFLAELTLKVTYAVQSTDIYMRIGGILTTGAVPVIFSAQLFTHLSAAVLCWVLAVVLFEPLNRNLDSAPITNRKPSRSIASRGRVWKYAVIWKEYRLTGGGHVTAYIKFFAFGILAILTGAASCGFVWSQFDLASAAAVMCGTVFFFLSIELMLLLARTFSTELTEKTWPTLNTLPASSTGLAYRKLAGVFVSMWPSFFWLGVSFLLSDMPEGVWTSMDTRTALGISAFFVHYAFFFHLVLFLSVVIRTSWGAIILAIFIQLITSIIVAAIGQISVAVASDYLGFSGNYRMMSDINTTAQATFMALAVAGLHFGTMVQLRRCLND
ncbi:MAG: hypothetical protein R3C18_19620 [Planctomycetaceae bacterium]